MPTLDYSTDEDLEVRANQQHFGVITGRRWIGIAFCYVMGAALLSLDGTPFLRYVGMFALAAGFCLTVLWWMTYSFLVRSARQQFARLSDPTVHVEYDDEGFEWSMEQGSRKARWSDVTKRAITKDFHLLYSDRVPIAAIPKALLTPELEAFLDAQLP